MEATHKKILKAISLELRHLLEGWYDTNDTWHTGDLEQRLAAIGIRRDRDPVPIDELPHLTDDDKHARKVVEAYLEIRRDAGIKLSIAVAEFVRETAYTWANRLLALRCMEARELIDEVILQKEVYGGRSLEHHRLAQRQPALCTGDDDGLFAVLDKVFTERSKTLPLLFDPKAPSVALKPTAAALKRCIDLLSGIEAVNGQNTADSDMFKAADALGWAYQYWNIEEKNRVFEKVRTKKGAKIEGADIIPATQLYTEPYMVKFLVQNSLGAAWVGIKPKTKLKDNWEYFVSSAEYTQGDVKPVCEITLIDPACGSGHFLIEAFDLFYEMYEEEGAIRDPEEICHSILKNNLYGIDIDERSIQIAEAVLWMKAAERALEFSGISTNLVATNICLPQGKDHLEEFLQKHPEDKPLRSALEVIFESLEHVDKLGSLLRIEEPVENELRYIRQREPLFHQQTDWKGWRSDVISRLKNHFSEEEESADFTQAFFSQLVNKGLLLFDLLSRRYDVVVANPPYLGFRKMGGPAHKILKKNYPKSCYDLYAVFLDKGMTLTSNAGYMAMVTMHSYMFTPSLEALRKRMIDDFNIRVLAHLGAFAFEELGDHAPAVLTILSKSLSISKPERDVTIIPYSPDRNKQKLLSDKRGIRQLPQSSFACVKGYPFVYDLTPGLLKLFETYPPLSKALNYRNGMFTTNNNRFLRYHWECPKNERWTAYYKVPTSERWYAPSDYSVDWGSGGDRLKTYSLSKHSTYTFNIVNERFFFRPGIVFKGTGSMGPCAKLLESGYICDIESTAIFVEEAKYSEYLFFHNSHLAAYLLSVINPTPHFYISDLGRLPHVKYSPEGRFVLSNLAEAVENCKKRMWSKNMPSRDYYPSGGRANSLMESWKENALASWKAGIVVSLCIGLAEKILIQDFGLDEEDVNFINSRTGISPGMLPIMHKDSLKHVENLFRESNASEMLIPVVQDYCLNLTTNYNKNIDSFDIKLNQLIKALDQVKPKIGISEIDDEIEQLTRFPNETILDKYATLVGMNPLDVYHGIIQEFNGNCAAFISMQREYLANLITDYILGLLGHRWQKEIEVSELPLQLDDADGIIPLSGGTSETTLLERLRECLEADFRTNDIAAIEREFSDIMNTPLNQWLEMEFFKHHVKQFKKRPIAIQIQSGAYTRKNKPGFSCLIYYHKINSDTLPKIRTQYVGPLRQRYETELRGIQAISIDARSERQDKRRVELERLIVELKEFDNILQKTSAEGFSSKNVEKHISKEKLDKWCCANGIMDQPSDREAFLRQESQYLPDINDGVRVNIAPLQKAGLLAANVLSKKDVDKAITDRAEWRSDERRWCREGRLPQPGWWQINEQYEKA